MKPKIRAIAFYLPQFYPIPENDQWWGKGFTEWNNVVKARPLFPGHYQPHLPADVGFYDLRVPEVREAQAELARQYGIYGFCYYHYWFNGKRILERPFEEVLKSGKPDFPFCLCWANENWTRAWDGGEREILLKQHYSFEDDRAHIRSLIPAFQDPRYIRIHDKPLFLVYRTELMPNPLQTAKIWRKEAKRCNIELYLARVESFTSKIDPRSIGFDASVEFAPEWRMISQPSYRTPLFKWAIRKNLLPSLYVDHYITRYDHLIQRQLSKPAVAWKRFRCATPGFDNSARRPIKNAAIFIGSTPEKYGRWLSTLAAETKNRYQDDERIIFINAWNEWAEGNHLEPDLRYGHAYLEATKKALEMQSMTEFPHSSPQNNSPSKPSRLRLSYWRYLEKLHELTNLMYHIRYQQARNWLS